MSGDRNATSPPEGPGREAVEADPNYTRIARQIVRDGARVIGFLTVTGKRHPVALTDLLVRLARSVTAFVHGDVALIPAWNEWKPIPGAPGAEGAPPRMTVREIEPRVIEVLPAASSDFPNATLDLERTLKVLSMDFAHVLVNLDGYAPPGRAPAAVAQVEAVALVIAAGAARMRDVSVITDQIPASKQLGAVLMR
jgi:hypothetical protein